MVIAFVRTDKKSLNNTIRMTPHPEVRPRIAIIMGEGEIEMKKSGEGLPFFFQLVFGVGNEFLRDALNKNVPRGKALLTDL